MDETYSMKLRNMAARCRKRLANNEPAARRCLFAFPCSLRPPASALISRRFSRQTCPYITRQLLKRTVSDGWALLSPCFLHVACIQPAGRTQHANKFIPLLYLQPKARSSFNCFSVCSEPWFESTISCFLSCDRIIICAGFGAGRNCRQQAPLLGG